MIDKDSKLQANFKEIGEYLKNRGNYSTAGIKVKNAFKDDEEFVLIVPSRIFQAPEYKSATRSVQMDNSFIEMALTRPKKPRNGAAYSEWNIYNNWKKLSDNDKLEFQLNKYAHDINCELIGFEII